MIAGVFGRRAVLLVVVALAIAGWIAAPYIASAAFILDLSGSTSWVRQALPVRSRAVTTRDIEVPTRYGPIPARLYQPDGGSDRSVVVFPGIHAGGVDEPRLAAFSRPCRRRRRGGAFRCRNRRFQIVCVDRQDRRRCVLDGVRPDACRMDASVRRRVSQAVWRSSQRATSAR
jgi:hypothetical protein